MSLKKKSEWLNALRSGNYEQGIEYLEANGAFCCLGVYCQVLGIRRRQGEGSESEESVFEYNVPDSDGVDEWTSNTEPDLNEFGLNGEAVSDLIRMNDVEKLSFSEIADWIEANL